MDGSTMLSNISYISKDVQISSQEKKFRGNIQDKSFSNTKCFEISRSSRH